MKKFFNLFYAALFAVLAISLTACSNDDEPDGGDIVGTWKNVSEIASAMGTTQYIRFESDGNYYEVNIMPDGYPWYGEVEVSKGNWRKNGNSLTISGEDFIKTTSSIKTLTNKKLVIETIGLSQEYKKVDNSVIDKYLDE